MLQQYLDIKAQHKDCVLFFRLGDFYEMFFDDAVEISRELELTLTGRDCGLPERAPMCGIPYHAAEGYIKRLIDKGYKVAICEQMEDPAAAKGLVKREIIRLVTPGTVIENNLLNEERNNYIASLLLEGDCFALCFADVSTGEVQLTCRRTKSVAPEVISELSRFTPSEILFDEGVLSYPEIGDFLKNKLQCVGEVYTPEELEQGKCLGVVLKHFKGQSLEDLGLSELPLGVRALGGLISYVNTTQKDGAMRLTSVSLYQEDQYVGLDAAARRNLELTETLRSKEKRGTLLWVLDKTRTAMGKRYMRKALEQPLMNLAEITRRQSAVEELFRDAALREALGEALSGVYDLERLMTRVIYGTVNPRELRALSGTLSHLPALKELAQGFSCPCLTGVNSRIHTLEDVYSLIENALVEDPPVALKDGGIIREGFHKELDEYRDLCANAKDYIARIEEQEKEKTGIKSLKVGYNRVFGYYIEVTNTYRDQVPEGYIRKQTLANCERYITQELKELEARVLSSSERILALEASIFDEVRRFTASRLEQIQETAGALARLDFLLSLANAAAENGYVRPEVTMSGAIRIQNGRHPVVEQMLKDALFVPNDTLLDTKENRMLILTGPNMAGKSTYMRQVAILVIMAQIGSFVPASSASIGICDRIFTRVGASDDLASGQSTFMVEMSEVAHILKNATPRSLVILDEIGRGTSTFDGMSIAKAVASHITASKGLGCKTLFATHYHELTSLEASLPGVKNYRVAVKKRGDDITFLRKIVPGGADESYGIEVAKLAGVPEAVVEAAKSYLADLEAAAPVRAAEGAPPVPQEDQLSFASAGADRLRERLKDLQLDTLTPIEALNTLFELKKLAGE